MEKLIIFGTGKIADCVARCVVDHGLFELSGFVIDKEHRSVDQYYDLPVVTLEEVTQHFSPQEFRVFVAVGYHDMNAVRQNKLAALRQMGYTAVSVIHPEAGLFSDLQYGENCFIMNNVNIQPGVVLGENTFVWSGAVVGHHTTIGRNNWITSGANVSGVVTTGDNCFFAIGATVANNVNIGERCFFGANCLVTKHVEDKAVVIAESDKPIRLNVDQFLKISKFS